jgi:hypothetical protein
MTEQHPITPPPELVEQWYNECPEANEASLPFVATQAARWGADQQLDQDAKWLDTNALFSHNLTITPSGGALRQVMRPKPPSLKEQALKILEEEPEPDDMKELIVFDTAQVEIIRRALEQLDD